MEEKNIIYIGNRKYDAAPPIMRSKFRDLSSLVFNNLEVIERVGKLILSSGKIDPDSYYRCRCLDCGKESIHSARQLKRSAKCRCQEVKERNNMKLGMLDTNYPTSQRFVDHCGEIINGIEVLRYAGRKKSSKEYYYMCKCHCGNEIIVAISSLRRGANLSCGCLLHQKNLHYQYDSNSHVRGVYRNMCQIKTQYNNSYEICPEWNDCEYGFDNFEKWAYENDYSEGKNILRKNPKLHYSPDNCIFVDSDIAKKFGNHNRIITIDEYSYPMSIWAEIVGIPTGTISARLNKRGWTEIDAVLTPVHGEPGIDVIQYTIPEKYIGLSGCGQ